MPAMALFHRRELLGTGLALISRLPGLVGHAVDGLAALVLADVSALGVGLLLEPIGQAVAAEAREIHQIDVLDIAAGPQMFDEAPKNRSFKFRSGFVVNRHGRSLAVCRGISTLSGCCHRFCHIAAQTALTGGISAAPCLKKSLQPLTAAARPREIISELI